MNLSKKNILSVLLFCTVSASAEQSSRSCNEMPFYESCDKTEEMKVLDAKFIEESKSVKGGIKASSEKLLNMGWNEIANNKPLTAIKRFNQLYLLEGRTPRTVWGMAVVESQLNNYSKAKSFFEEAINLDPKNFRLLCDSGFSRVQENLFLFQGEPTEEKRKIVQDNFVLAEKLYHQAIKVNTKSALPHTRLAELAYYQNNKEQAIKEAKLSQALGGEGLDPRFLKEIGIMNR